MKTKAGQLEELKATAVKLQQQIEELEKPKQWEPRGGRFTINSASVVGNTPTLKNSLEVAGLGWGTITEKQRKKLVMLCVPIIAY